MDFYSLLMAAVLGVVEGITEFLPISSTGHLILVEDLLGFEGPPGKFFEIIIQLGAILSVVWVYRVKLWNTALGLFTQGPAQRLTLNVLIAFLRDAHKRFKKLADRLPPDVQPREGGAET